LVREGLGKGEVLDQYNIEEPQAGRYAKILAEMAARSVPGAFSVTDNLTIG
jgi:hypothetical protein